MIFFIFYQILITLLEIIFLLPLSLILLAAKSGQRLGMGIPAKRSSIWFHAASMGEVNALRPLLLKAVEKYGVDRIILTTMTKTGRATARSLSTGITTAYIPLDLPLIMSIFYRKIKPSMIIIMETEFWPQMLFQARQRKVPVILINARLSASSFKKYKITGGFWKIPWQAFRVINSQSEKDDDRFRQLGFKHVRNCGNLKFAISLPGFEVINQRIRFGISLPDFVIVLGSSRPGEEQMIKDIYPELKKQIPNLKLIIVPRHLRRIIEVESIFREDNMILFTNYSGNERFEIMIIDKIGLLTEVYSFSDLVIVGGSLTDFGGHNPLEAVFYSKAVIMGQYHSSCLDSVQKLQERAGIIITEPDKLLENILNLFNDRKLRIETGINGHQVLIENSHSLKENLDTIESYLE